MTKHIKRGMFSSSKNARKLIYSNAEFKKMSGVYLVKTWGERARGMGGGRGGKGMVGKVHRPGRGEGRGGEGRGK